MKTFKNVRDLRGTIFLGIGAIFGPRAAGQRSPGGRPEISPKIHICLGLETSSTLTPPPVIGSTYSDETGATTWPGPCRPDLEPQTTLGAPTNHRPSRLRWHVLTTKNGKKRQIMTNNHKNIKNCQKMTKNDKNRQRPNDKKQQKTTTKRPKTTKNDNQTTKNDKIRQILSYGWAL